VQRRSPSVSLLEVVALSIRRPSLHYFTYKNGMLECEWKEDSESVLEEEFCLLLLAIVDLGNEGVD